MHKTDTFKVEVTGKGDPKGGYQYVALVIAVYVI